VKVFLVDGTYELFRHYHGAPKHLGLDGTEVGATRAALGSMLGMLEGGASYMAVATDHVIESWRNAAWPSYKSSAGVPADLLGQFSLFEDALAALGLVVWPMVDLEADDALASGAAVLNGDERLDQVLICTPDKDLGQCVRGTRVVCLDRRKDLVVDEAAVRARFGVAPAAVPDWLALVGDSADGYPGLPGWGPKAASVVLGHYGDMASVPLSGAPWPVELPLTRQARLREALREGWEQAQLFKRLATCVLRPELLPPGPAALDSLQWAGPGPGLAALCDRLGSPGLHRRAEALAATRAGGGR
jgi:5'-3' exonuclease